MGEFVNDYGTTLIFVSVIVGWMFLKGLPNFKDEISQNPFGDYDEPRTVSALGVLGTFIGISLGLFDFDVKGDAVTSVANLLNGMRTAFITSIVGMAGSLYMKYLQNNQQKLLAKEVVNDDASIKDLIMYFRQRDAQTAGVADNIIDSLQDIRHAIVGDGEDTVISQIKVMRLEVRDELRSIKDNARNDNQELIKEFQEFARTMAENNAKSFIEALTETMKDFNTKLTEQFGENFKQLNIAVGKLLEWQENYRDTIKEVTELQKEIFEGINDVRDSLTQIEISSSGMKVNADKMANLIVTAEFYNEKMASVLSEVSRLGAEARDMVPVITKSVTEVVALNKEQIQNMSNDAISGIKTTSESANDILDEVNEISKNVGALSKKASDNLNSAISSVEKETNEAVAAIEKVALALREMSKSNIDMLETESKATKDVIEKMAKSLHDSALTITKNVADNLEQINKDNNEYLKKSSENLSKDLDKKLTESLESLGRVLLTISSKFAKDYSPIADKLNEILNLVNGLQTGRRGVR